MFKNRNRSLTLSECLLGILAAIIGISIIVWVVSILPKGWEENEYLARAARVGIYVIIGAPVMILVGRRVAKKLEEQKNAALNEERERIAAIVSEARQRDAERQHLLCPTCGGSGQKIEGELCPTCGGRGTRDGEPCSPCEAPDAPAPTEEDKDIIL